MKKAITLILLSTIMVFSSIFKAQAQNDEPIEVLPVAEYREAVIGKTVQLVDVRTQAEFQAGHIQKAVNIDLFQPVLFSEKFANFNKEEPLYIYCRSGNRSQTAARKLVQMGFKKVYDLEGGFINWN